MTNIICPQCDKSIDHIVNVCRKSVIYEFDGDEFEEVDDYLIDDGTFECPECGEIVADSFGDALELWKKVVPPKN